MNRAIIFDLFGVIYPSTFWVLADNHIPNMTVEEHNQLGNIIMQSDLGNLNQRDFWEMSARAFGVTYEDLILEKNSLGEADEKLLEYIKDLKKRGLKIGLLSNVGHGFVDKIIKKSRQKKFFDSMILSGEVGFLKPSREIYKLSIQSLGLPANRCLFFDDSERNVLAAREMGMHSEIYTGVHQSQIDIENFLLLSDTDI